MNWHIGCSGFLYRDWKTVFYPEKLPQRRWFEYYTSQFDTLELNVSFYKFPEVHTLKKWYDIAPPHFLFSLKAPRLITHFKQMKDCERYLADLYHAVDGGLQEKCGCVLFQFPPKFIYSEERLELLVSQLRPGYKNVVEMRSPTWWNPTAKRAFKKAGIIFSGLSHPQLPDHTLPHTDPPFVYYRFHGIPKLFYSPYEDAVLEETVQQIARKKTVRDVFIYFNNTASPAAIQNARKLQEYIAEHFNSGQSKQRTVSKPE